MTLKADFIKLTDERNEWQTRCEFSFEQRDKLTAERDEYREKYNSTYSALDDCARLHSSVVDERDALKEAAKLALTALNRAVPKNARQASEQTEAIEILKAVL